MTETYASAQTESSQFLLMHRIFTFEIMCGLRGLDSMQDSAAKQRLLASLPAMQQALTCFACAKEASQSERFPSDC